MDSERISNPDELNKKSKKVSKLSQKSYSSLLNQLKNYIKSLKPKKQISTWEKYSKKNLF